jgi:hypothetical protein
MTLVINKICNGVPSYRVGGECRANPKGLTLPPNIYPSERYQVNIGKHDFWINNLKIARPQYVVALDNERNGKFNFTRMTYVALISVCRFFQRSKRYAHAQKTSDSRSFLTAFWQSSKLEGRWRPCGISRLTGCLITMAGRSCERHFASLTFFPSSLPIICISIGV